MAEGVHQAATSDPTGTGKSIEPEAGQLRVFISYSRDDIGFADQLVAGLEVTGFDVALDRHGITGGEDFQRRLGALIREADTVVFVLSPSSVRSPMCAWEVDEAVGLGKRILPVVCRDLEGNDPPPRLKNLDYVYFYADPKVAGAGFGHGLARLVAALKTDLGWLREHTRLLARATEWETAGRLSNRMLSGADIDAAKQWASKRPKGAPEPTALHLDYIRASENAEKARTSAEHQRLAEITRAQAEREEALGRAEIAQQENAKASQRLIQRTMAGMVVALVLAVAASAAGMVAWTNQQAAENQRQRAEGNLDAITEALEVLDHESDPKQVAQSFSKLAGNYVSQNRTDEAVTLYKRSLAIFEKQLGAESAEAAETRSQLGFVYVKAGNVAEAEPLLKDALAAYERSGDTERSNVATILSLLAEIYRSQGRAAEEAKIGDRARTIAMANVAFEQPVFFATDRATAPNPSRSDYGPDRGRRLALGRALVTVPKIHRLSNIERPWLMRVPYLDVTVYAQPENPRWHFTIQQLNPLTEAEFSSASKEYLTASKRFKDRALVFIHGSGISFDNAIYRTAQLAYNLRFDGAAFAYSWPSSGGETQSYIYDNESAQQAVPYLREFLNLVAAKSGAKSISIIAHSMGSTPLLRVLQDLASSNPPGVAIDQLIFAVPDVDRDMFQNIAGSFKGIAKGITLYVASNDRALTLSRAFWGGVARAGDVPADGPLIVQGVDTIDISAAAANGAMGRSPDILFSDIDALLDGGVRPPDSRTSEFVTIQSASGPYWQYRP